MDGYTNKAKSIINNINKGIITTDDIEFVLNECKRTLLDFHTYSMAFRIFSYSEEKIENNINRDLKSDFRDYFKVKNNILREIRYDIVDSVWNKEKLFLLRKELINIHREIRAMKMELEIYLKYENSLSVFIDENEKDYDAKEFINSLWRELRYIEDKMVVRKIITKIVSTLPWKLEQDKIFNSIDKFFEELYSNALYSNNKKILIDAYESLIRQHSPLKTIKNYKLNSLVKKIKYIKKMFFIEEGKLSEKDNELFFILIKNIEDLESDSMDILEFFNNVCGASILVNKRYELPEQLKQFLIETDLEKMNSDNFQNMELKYEETIQKMNITDMLLSSLWESDLDLGEKQNQLDQLMFSVLLAKHGYFMEKPSRIIEETKEEDYNDFKNMAIKVIKETMENEPEKFVCWRNNRIISGIYGTMSGEELKNNFIEILNGCKSIERANYENYITLEFENMISPKFDELKEG